MRRGSILYAGSDHLVSAGLGATAERQDRPTPPVLSAVSQHFHRPEVGAPRPGDLVCGGSRETRTMMQPCASAAKLRGGGPIPHRGSAAMLALGSPPPRAVIGRSPRGRGRAPD